MDNTNLNKLESAIFKALVIPYPALKPHIPHLFVKSRELTGVGMYVNFGYNTIDGPIKKLDYTIPISTNQVIEFGNLQYGLNYEVSVTDGMIDCIEFVTNGESWDGNTTDFEIK